MAAEDTRPTLADYVALAISPALIIGLVASLVFFLIDVLYAGDYADRMRWILFFFVFGAVLIARISMTGGIADRAGLYGIGLGVPTWIGMQIFVEYPKDSAIADLSWVINLGLIGVVWWCAHRLTWDCTEIEGDGDTTGQGALQAAGLQEAAPEAAKEPAAEPQEKPPGWLERFRRYREQRNKKRTLGVWVVWFSLAALPIFGLGQSLIPASDAARRQGAFWLMTVYVGCGLGLLLTTCFLGLRRYLRQRKLRMPPTMAGAWLALGGGLIALLLVAGAFLPRPEAEYPFFDFTGAGSEKRDASNLAFKGGKNAGKGEGRPGAEGKPEDKGAGGNDGEKGEGDGQRKGDGEAGKDGDGKAKGNDGDTKGQDGSDKKGDDGDNNGNKSGDDKKAEGRQGEADNKQAGSGPKKGEQANRKSGGQSGSESSSSSHITAALKSIAGVLKWIVFAIVILIVAFVVLRALLRFLANFTGWAQRLLDALRNLWESLFGRRKQKQSGEPEPEQSTQEASRAVPFSAFANPFDNGQSSRMSPAELVRYTFAAVQAWGRERGLERQVGETALEYVERLAADFPTLDDALRRLVMLYGRAVYSQAGLPANAVEAVEQVWQRLEAVVEQPLSA